MKVFLFLLALLPLVAVAAQPHPALTAWSAKSPQAHTVLVRSARWVVPAACLPHRELGSDAAGRELGAANAGRELGSDNASRELGSANAGRELGAGSAGRELGAANAGRELGGDAAGRDLGSANAGRELGAADAGRELGAANAGRELGGDAAGRDLGSAAIGRDLGAANSTLACEVAEDRGSVIIHGVAPEDFSLPAGSAFKRFAPGPDVRSVRVFL